jgi:hypothetical protein
MPSQDAMRAPGPESAGPAGPSGSARGLSRRSLLQGAATAGAAGLAVTALGAAASPALALSPPGTSRPPAPDQSRGHGAAAAGPIVVHVRDARSGDIEVFSGTSQSRVRDKDLAARIARTIG